MMRKTITRLFALPLLLTLSSTLCAQSDVGADWPQWRGPERTGVSTETDWSAVGKATPVWEKALGLGHSSFAVVANRVYTLGYDADAGLDVVFCLDADSGEELWTFTYAAEIWDSAQDGGTQTTPTVVGDVVYTSNREGKVFCLDSLTGEQRWKRDLQVEQELEPPTWGFSASPLLVGEHIVMNLGRVAALDRHSGEDVWITERNYGIAYSTPAFFELDGRQYLASLSGDGLVVLDSSDGSEVAFHAWVKRPQIYPMTPVIIGDRIFISGGYQRGCTMLQLTDGKLVELWASRAMRNKMSGCVLWRDHLFGFDESILKCIDLDGKMRWRVRGLGTGSMSIAGGRLVILDGKGQLIIAEANPEEYVELSRQAVYEDGTSWSTPVLSHGRVFCRSSLGQMTCLDYRPAEGATIAASAAKLDRSLDLPSPQVLVARHMAAIGGMAVFDDVASVRMTGKGESLRNTVQTGTVELDWSAEAGFSWRDESGYQLAHDSQMGWEMGGGGPPEILEGETLLALREAGDLAHVFHPASRYSKMRTTKATVFDNRDCHAVECETADGYQRTIYFEVESGLFAGHEGDGITMWTLSAYHDFSGVMLPTRWAFYEPIKGEMNSAVFEEAVINPPLEADAFAVPDLVKLFLRSPEEIAVANARLEKAHATILGDWHSDDGPADGPISTFLVADGFLVFAQTGRDPSPLTEPREDGSFAIIGAEYVSLTPEKDESGNIEAFKIYVAGDLRVTLVRSAD